MIHDAYEGKFLNDRYKLLSKIGCGGMSVVYKAKDAEAERFVAVKILKEEFCNDEDFIRRFNNEANAAKKLSHPYIVEIYDVGCDGDIHYIVMELIEGITLKDYIVAKHSLKWRDTLNITGQILTALDHAHEHKIIHRDIKPQNIMLTPGGVVKLADFGIAKAVSGATKSATPDSAGSVHYLSPEQARGGFVDERTDIYSTGIMMFEMVTGTVPYDGDSHVSIALKHIDGKITPPHEIDPGIPRGVSDLIVLATKKDPAMRFQSAKDMLLRLEKVLNAPYTSFLNTVPTIHDVKTEPVNITEEDIKGKDTPAEISDDAFIDDDDFFDDSEDVEVENISKPVAVSAAPEDTGAVENEPYEYYEEEPAPTEFSVRNIVFATITYAIAIIVGIVGIYFIHNRYQAAKDNIIQFVDTKVYLQDYSGMQVSAVEAALAEYDVNVDKVLVETDKYPSGYIISQDLPKGTELKSNLRITFEVSSVEGSFVLEDYSSSKRDYKEIGSQLEANGAVVTYKSVYSSKVNDTLVVRTSPKAGSIINPGTEVIIYYSAGTMYSYVNVPDLTGMTLEEAKAALEKINLKLGVVFPEPGSIVDGLYSTPVIATPTPTIDPNATPGTEPSATTGTDITPETSITPDANITPEASVNPPEATPDSDVPIVLTQPTDTPEAPATPGIDETPGADVTPGIDETPGADVTPGIDETPGADATPEITPTPTPTPTLASLTVVGQYPGAYQTVLANETVHVFFYHDMSLLTQYKTVSIEDPMMAGFTSYYIYAEVEDHEGTKSFPLGGGAVVEAGKFPLQFNVPVSVLGEPTKISIYVGANAITAQLYEIKYVYADY